MTAILSLVTSIYSSPDERNLPRFPESHSHLWIDKKPDGFHVRNKTSDVHNFEELLIESPRNINQRFASSRDDHNSLTQSTSLRNVDGEIAKGDDPFWFASAIKHKIMHPSTPTRRTLAEGNMLRSFRLPS
jgi:hypothetical protein